MNLRQQLAVIAGLLCLLPILVLRFALTLEESLRATQQANQLELSGFIGRALTDDLRHKLQTKSPYIIKNVQQPLILDGYSADWDELAWVQNTSPSLPARLKLAVRQEHLYLLIQATDDSIVYKRPGTLAEIFDRFDLVLYSAHEPVADYSIFSDGPGFLKLRGKTAELVTGFWQTDAAGSLLEIRVPLPEPLPADLQLNIVWLDVDQGGDRLFNRQQRLFFKEGQPLPLLFFDQELVKKIEELTPKSARLSIYMPSGQTLFELDKDYRRDIVEQKHPWRALVRKLLLLQTDSETWSRPTTDPMAAGEYSKAMHSSGKAENDQPYSHWQQTPNTHYASLTSHYPIIDPKNAPQPIAWVSIEKRTAQVAAVADAALFSVLSQLFVLVVVVMLILFGYASWLSWRVRHLKDKLVNGLDPESKFKKNFTPSNINDELGDLSRNFATMLSRLKNYADYMETFASKFAHECRTPLAIISSSLQLLENAKESREQQEYLQRAQTGTARISKLLTAMRQATQLEASIQQQEKSKLDLTEMVKTLGEAYKQLVLPANLQVHLPCHSLSVHANGDLLAQAIDKLVDNAKDYTPRGADITLGLKQSSSNVALWVENQGPLIPEELLDKLFDPFVSVRENSDEELHLGLGLLIVKLIAEYHNAEIRVQNLEHQNQPSVRFTILLPFTE